MADGLWGLMVHNWALKVEHPEEWSKVVNRIVTAHGDGGMIEIVWELLVMADDKYTGHAQEQAWFSWHDQPYVAAMPSCGLWWWVVVKNYLLLCYELMGEQFYAAGHRQEVKNKRWKTQDSTHLNTHDAQHWVMLFFFGCKKTDLHLLRKFGSSKPKETAERFGGKGWTQARHYCHLDVQLGLPRGDIDMATKWFIYVAYNPLKPWLISSWRLG